MEFRLLWQGPLRSEGGSDLGPTGRAADKQVLRKHFHRQLRELWKLHPHLRRMTERDYVVLMPGVDPVWERTIVPAHGSLTKHPTAKPWIEHIADDHMRLGTRFVPLVSKMGGFTCSLDILFLRRDQPGSLVIKGGDIDNRIKVLLDGLRMPDTLPEMGGIPLEAEENPFFCLLEDDALLTRVAITTDLLITPLATQESVHDVMLVITATVVNPSAIFAGGRLI